MSCNNSVQNRCPVTCPKVREQLRKAIKEWPNVTDGIFPRKTSDVKSQLPSDIISRDTQAEPKWAVPVENDVRPEAEPIVFREHPIIQKPYVTPTETITNDIEKKIDSIKKEELIHEPTIDQEETSTGKTVDRDEEKIKFVKEEVEVKRIATESLIEKPESIKDKIERAPPEIELEPSQELENHFEPEESMEYVEEEYEKSMTDYDKYIDEELQKSLPAVIAREIPEKPRAVHREISKKAVTLHERIDRERPPREREAVVAMPEERPDREEIFARRILEDSVITEQIALRKAAVDACEGTCPLVQEQKERIIRKLEAQQRVVDHYYLTKGFRYFEDVCTCSLACMVYTLGRDPFAKSIFASLALFAVGLKLCSELDAWEMPSHVS